MTLYKKLFTEKKKKNKLRDMNYLKINGNWDEKKGRLKQKFVELTDEDLQYAEGKDEELIGRIQKRMGTSKFETIQIIRNA